jgi:hypothetical protein
MMSEQCPTLTLAEVCRAGRLAWKDNVIFVEGHLLRLGEQRAGTEAWPAVTAAVVVHDVDGQLFRGWAPFPDCDCAYCRGGQS